MNDAPRPNGFVFYRAFFEAIERADDEEQLQLYRAITRYALEGTPPEFKGLLQSVWLMIKAQIDVNRKRYENGCKGAAHGHKGGRPKETPPEPQENPTEPPIRARRFVVPTLEEIRDYIVNNSLSDESDREAERIFDYYTSKGWKVGNSPMKDWKAAVRNWCRNSFTPRVKPVPALTNGLSDTSPGADKDYLERF